MRGWRCFSKGSPANHSVQVGCAFASDMQEKLGPFQPVARSDLSPLVNRWDVFLTFMRGASFSAWGTKSILLCRYGG